MSGFSADDNGKFSDTRDVNTALQQGLLKKAFVGGQDYFECVVCHRSMAGTVPAAAHLGGSPHFKALRNHTYSSSLSESLSRMYIGESFSHEEDTAVTSSHLGTSPYIVKRAIEDGIVTQSHAAGVTTLTCELCKVPCTGDTPMAQHLDGEPHRKRQRRMGGVVESRSPQASVSSVRPGTGAVVLQKSFSVGATGTDVEDTLQKAFKSGIIERESSNGVDSLICHVCCKSCTGVVPMKQHLESSAHIRKLRSSGIPVGGGEKFTSSIIPSPTAYDSLSVGSDTCSVGSRDYEEEVVPLVTDGSASSSNDNKNPRAEAESEEVVIEVDGMLMCLVCQVQCTGKANMAEHLQGDHHRRKWRDQVDQLKMFGTNVSTPRSTPSPKPSLSPKLPVENAKKSVTQNLLQSNSSNQSCRNLYVQQQVDRQRPYKLAKINLPENLSDLEVYFPDEPLGRNF
ncbi:uncharacterized protein [Macrobrachium rosenbergii]|uniref:uncharacterized protein isoform X2 n=1 Tax=Macrobrachium rosenbergii TaxID=79674 RepID=UPI0034D717DE